MPLPGQQPQDPTIDRPQRWPLIIMPSNRAEDTSTDARLVNGFMEKELQGDSWLYKRPGLSELTNPGGAGLAQGVYNWQDDIYVIVNGHLYKNGVDKGGTIDTTNGVYRFSSIMGAVPKLVFANGVKAFCYDDTGGLQDFTGAMPFYPDPFTKGVPFLDGRIYVMTPDASIYGSLLNDIISPWDSLNVIIAQIDPGFGIALAKQMSYIIAFKQTSTEVFYDAGTTPGTLGRIQGQKVNFGCISADSVRQLDGALFWLCTNESAAVQVMKMDNLRPEVISSPAVERLLESADFSEVWSWTLKLGGHKWYAVTLVNNNLTLVYDMTTGLWAQWTDTNGDCLQIVDSSFKTDTAETILQHATNGWLYTVSNSQYTDAGDAIRLDIYTPNYDAGTIRDKTIPAMYFDCSQVVGSVLQVRHSDDDYQTWSQFRTVPLNQKKPQLQNEGTFKRRAYNLRHESPTSFRIKSADFQMAIGLI